jgi:DNA-binding response OmpR family regulator/pSer/pThr/pTyr-binding forkhead associated (FHA) protein
MAETLAIPWVIELHNQQMPETLKVQIENQLTIGRYDKASQAQPDIDLGGYGAEEKGVSRRHLTIRAEEDQLVVIDLNSGNGTFLNGNKLEPNAPHPVKNEDKLQLGLMQLELRVIISPKGSGFQMPGKQGITPRAPAEGTQPILIVEDEPEVAKVLALVLERNGYGTVTCREVVSAIRLFNQKQPSAVILDLMLPDMPGLEFCRYVRRDVQRNTTPVIVISAAKTPANVTQALDAGADIFLGKPVSAQELNHVVDSLIGQNETGDRALHTKQLVGTAPLKSVPPESRRDSIVMFVAGHEQPLTLTLHQPVTFGRTTNMPPKLHVDLSRFNAVEHGVSRVHMTLHSKDGKFFVEDMDSVNGTYINGDPLKPRELTALKNADEVRLGRLRLYTYFLEDGKNL